MKCEIVNISPIVASKYPAIKQMIEDNLITAIDYGYVVEASWSWLVDLTPEQKVEFDALTIELNKKYSKIC